MNYNELKNTVFHTAIIGAGAGGLFCAGSFNSPKVLIEHNTHPGKKISISGGGKCNFSNRFAKSTDYDCANKHFVKNALAAFKPQDFVSLLDEAGLKWEERQDGQLFAMDARDIVRFLIRRAREANTQILTDTQALDVRQENGLFTVNTSAGPVRAQRVVLATGGLSFPALGASNFGIKIARQFGLNIIPQRPALVGLTFDKALREQFFKLAGNTLNALQHFAHLAGASGMVGGQTADVYAEGMGTQEATSARAEKIQKTSKKLAGKTLHYFLLPQSVKETTPENVLLYIHANKTGALIRASVETGALLAGVKGADLKHIQKYAECIGLVFQIVDDILDVTASAKQLGKSNSDAQNGKLTFVSLYGLEGSRKHAQLLIAKAQKALDSLKTARRKNLAPLYCMAEFFKTRTY